MKRLEHRIEPVVVDEVKPLVQSIVAWAIHDEKLGGRTFELLVDDLVECELFDVAKLSRHHGVADTGDEDDQHGEDGREDLSRPICLLEYPFEPTGDQHAGKNDGLDGVVQPDACAQPGQDRYPPELRRQVHPQHLVEATRQQGSSASSESKSG